MIDWPERGLDRHIIAARIHGGAGRWLSLTWSGYTGVLQAVAPRRFAASLNQAPMEKLVGLYPLDWLVNTRQRRVFEEAADFGMARRMLIETPVALPTI